jgi:sulfatase maturation enzyme AslB (radical SAM superfamily)
MKYEFIEKTIDEYELHYTDKNGKEKVIPFKRTVELATKLQSADAEARLELYNFLTSVGKSKKDFIIERTDENGKIIVDETNYREFESDFLMKKQFEIAMNIYKTVFKMEFTDLLLDMGISENTAEDFATKLNDFSLELRDILVNGKVKNPSPKKDENKQDTI